MATNMGSAVVLMTAGDVMAQEIELHDAGKNVFAESGSKEHDVHHVDQRFATTVAPEQEAKLPKLSFRRYGTLSPNIEERRKEDIQEIAKEEEDEFKAAAFLRNFQESLRISARGLHTELTSLDPFRSGTMACWGGLTTPFFITMFRLFDRYLPRNVTPASVLPRVGITFLFSIPVNAIFFCYGSFVHHAAEYYSLVQEWQLEMRQLGFQDMSLDEVVKELPFDFEMAWSTTRLKLERELVPTIIASASVWIPFNSFNFSMVPPHLRPVTVMAFSAFWNCYLSLAQHRDA